MHRIAPFAVIATTAVLLLGAAPGQAAASDRVVSGAASEISAQLRADRFRNRPRTQLRVYPRYPHRSYHTFHALPYGIDYPGPNVVRQCVSRLVQEHRPSGTVIVPRMRCWWARR